LRELRTIGSHLAGFKQILLRK